MLDLFIILGATAILFFGFGALFGTYTIRKQSPFKCLRCQMTSNPPYLKRR